MYILLCVMVAAFIAALIFMPVYKTASRRRRAGEDAIYVRADAAAKVRWQHQAYQFLSTFPLTKRYIEKIRIRYEIIAPGDIRKTENDTVKTALTVWGISLSVFLIGFLIDFSFYMVCICGMFTYGISALVIYKKNKEKEILLMEQLNNYINDVEHEFYSTNMVESAVSNALINAEEPVYSHMFAISEMLDSLDYDENARSYIHNTNNQFLRLFLSACELVNKFDDRIVKGYSSFIMNLSNIKTEIGIWLRTQSMIQSAFQGHEVMILLPMLFIPLINRFAPYLYEDIAHYYNGSYGIIMSVFICLTTMFLYGMVTHMKDLEYRDNNEHELLQRIANIPFINRALDSYEEEHYGRVVKLNRILSRMGANMNARYLRIEQFLAMIGMFLLSVIVSFAIVHAGRVSALEIQGSLEASLYYVTYDNSVSADLALYAGELLDEYVSTAVPCDAEAIQEFLLEERITNNAAAAGLMAEAVCDAVSDYRNTYFRWWYLFLCGAVAAIGYQVPYLMIQARKSLLEITQENEVIQFQSIISMLMHLEEMCPEEILKWMYRFSNIFRSSIEACISRYSDGDETALEKLKEEEPFLPFQRLVDNLIDSDTVGVEKAFLELDGDRAASQKRREQEHKQYIEKMAATASLLVFVPILLVVLGYLTVPMLLAAYNGMSAMNAGLM